VSLADLGLDDRALLGRCREERSRSAGPGGQHANRTESAVRLVHLASGVAVRRDDRRSQAENRAAALRDLRLALACACRGGSDPAWLAPHLVGGRIALGPAARSYPQAVACALDALEAAGGRLAGAAAALGATTTQFARLLAAEGRVKAAADAIRAKAGLGRIRT
jgi:hypothetical protein